MISRLEQLEVKEFTIEEEYFTPDADLTKIALKFKSKKIIDINETGNFVIIKSALENKFVSSHFFIFLSEYQQWTDKFVKLEKSLKKSNPDDNQLETHAKLLRDAKTSRDVQKRIRTWLNEKFTKPLRRM